MNRREFLHQLGLFTGGMAFGLNGVPVRAYAHNPLMFTLKGESKGNVLVMVQLAGGNDGLNTVVPYQNDIYYQKRPNLAIPKDKVLPLSDTLGLHPSMAGFQELFNNGKLSIVQNVGYQNPNRSHFRSTDIWMSASDASEVFTEGWVGRYLSRRYPEFPITLPEQPMAVQIGSVESMLTLSELGSMGVVFDDPNAFYQLVQGSSANTDSIPNTAAGEEFGFLQQIAAQSIQYSDIIKKKADQGKNAVTYPNTNIGRQLSIVAELIAGGLETPVYLTKLDGFDTHANQITTGNVTGGLHATLLRYLSEAVTAFQKDMEKQGQAERVTVMTFSEFGRRVSQNGTTGTDHGTAAPLFVVGNPVKGGWVGAVPNLADLDNNGDLKFKNDFRQVYASVLRDHLGVDAATTRSILNRDFEPLPIFRRSSAPVATADGIHLEQNAPNPFTDVTEIRYSLAKAQDVQLTLFDMQGREIVRLREGRHDVGVHSVMLSGYNLAAGYYLYGLRTEVGQRVLRLVKL